MLLWRVDTRAGWRMHMRTIKLGGADICADPMLAPMAGVTDAAFRMACRELGARGLMFTEMVSAKGLCHKDRKSLEIARVGPADRPVAAQIFGSDPAFMAEAASMLCDAFPDIDAIDINMGCPMPKITKNGDGAALMLDAARAAAIVRAVAGAIGGKPVSVKIRKGWDAARADAAEFAKALECAGASMVCVHGRTRDQMYSGRADWDAIACVKRAVGIPVVGNGDVSTPEDARLMLDSTGCDAVMVGRGALGNPWLLREIADGAQKPSLGERKAAMRRHLELAVAFKGERTGVLEMRKHLAWYVKGMRNASVAKDAIFKACDAESMERCIDALGS